jgi:hypothetical protein
VSLKILFRMGVPLKAVPFDSKAHKLDSIILKAFKFI